MQPTTNLLIKLFQFQFDSFSGSSSGSGGSIPHSFSVDEIQKMRVKLKSSKSYPNELLMDGNATKQQQKNDDHSNKQPSKILTKDTLSANHDECDNSSSGVSSDQEVTAASNVKTTIANKPIIINNSNKIISTNANETTKHGILKTTTTAPASMANKIPKASSISNTINSALMSHNTPVGVAAATAAANASSVKIVESINKKSINLPPLSNVTKKISAAVSERAQNANDEFDDFDDDLPAKGFQRQVSLTRKQAATIAMNRAFYTKSAVSLAQLPPPLEGDSDDPDYQQSHCQAECRKNNLKVID